MANKWMGDLVAGTTPLTGDYIETLQGADTEIKKITFTQILVFLRTALYGTAGQGISIKEGTNAKAGVATLVAGTVTVLNSSVTATSRIKLTVQSLGTVTRPAAVGVTARVAATSFTIMSGDVTDTSVVYWEINENT